MAIKKYSRPISFLLFIEYGTFISVVASLFFNVSPKEEYAEQAKFAGVVLLLHAFLCLMVAAFTEALIRKRLKVDSISSKLYTMLGALVSLPFALLVAALLLLPSLFSSGWNVVAEFKIFAVAVYFVSLILPYLLIFLRLRKKSSTMPE